MQFAQGQGQFGKSLGVGEHVGQIHVLILHARGQGVIEGIVFIPRKAQQSFTRMEGGMDAVAGGRFTVKIVQPGQHHCGRRVFASAYPALWRTGFKTGGKGQGVGLELLYSRGHAAQNRTAITGLVRSEADVQAVLPDGGVFGAGPGKVLKAFRTHSKGAAHDFRSGRACQHGFQRQVFGQGLPVKPAYHAAKVQGFPRQV